VSDIRPLGPLVIDIHVLPYLVSLFLRALINVFWIFELPFPFYILNSYSVSLISLLRKIYVIYAPGLLSPFCGGRITFLITQIAMLTGVFILLVGPQNLLKDRGQTKQQLYTVPSFVLLTFLFLSFICPNFPFLICI